MLSSVYFDIFLHHRMIDAVKFGPVIACPRASNDLNRTISCWTRRRSHGTSTITAFLVMSQPVFSALVVSTLPSELHGSNSLANGNQGHPGCTPLHRCCVPTHRFGAAHDTRCRCCCRDPQRLMRTKLLVTPIEILPIASLPTIAKVRLETNIN